MQFGLYTPAAVATIGSPEIAQSIAEARQPLPDGKQDLQLGVDLDVLMAADASGFDLALFAERHLGTDLSAWVVAGAGGLAILERMRALIAVHPGLFDPVMAAKLAASVDRICKGRMAINIVNGWYEQEFRMFGGKILEGEERYRRSKEFIEILRGLWREDVYSFSGHHYTIDKAELMLKPASRTPPEIYSVSSTDIGRDFIAETCDWWFVGMPNAAENTDEALAMIEAAIADMEKRTRALGRKVHYALNPFLGLGNSMEEALAAAIEKIFAFEPDPENRSPDRTRQIERRMLPATKAGLIGRAEDVRRQVRRFEDMGIELLLLKVIPNAENVRRIGVEVIDAA